MDGDLTLTKTAQPKRRATNVTLSVELLNLARELGLNVSQACEQGLKAEVSKRRAAQWVEENREAIESYNEYVDRHGIPLSEYRQF